MLFCCAASSQARLVLSRRSMATVYAILSPWLVTKGLTLSASVSVLTPMTTKPSSPYSFWSDVRCGMDFLLGVLVVAQNSTMYTLPGPMVVSEPLTQVSMSNPGAWFPTASFSCAHSVLDIASVIVAIKAAQNLMAGNLNSKPECSLGDSSYELNVA